MAPRGRTRKPRSSRMDGAIDNMSTYGFPEDLVRRKVKNLLQVYGGEWLFIEADSYSVLLEGLLEEATTNNEEKSRQGENMLVDNPPPDERDEDPDLLPSVGSSSGVAEQPICPQIINTEPQAGATGGMDCSMEVEENGKGSEDNNVSKNISEKEIINGPGNTTKGFCGAEVHVGKKAAHSPPPPVISPPSVEANPPRRRRKPCHGWISDGEDDDDDDDDDDDFIDLPPAPRLISTPAATTKDKGKKRKTRWDVRPEEYV